MGVTQIKGVVSTSHKARDIVPLTLFKAGGGRNQPGPVLFRPKHPEVLQKVGVMGYVNLS